MKKRKKSGRIWHILIINFLAIVALYIALAYYYSTGFPCCCWINGVYCTGKSVETVNKELISERGYAGINVVDSGGAELYISADSVDLAMDYTEALNSFIASRNPLAWGINLFENLILKIEPTVDLDEDKLVDFVCNWEIFSDTGSNDVFIVNNGNGYELINDLVDVPDKQGIVNAVYRSILGLKSELQLSEAEGCYIELEPDERQKSIIAAFDKINELQNLGITYDIEGEEISFGPAVASKWIVTEADIEEASNEENSSENLGSGLFIINGQQRAFPLEEEVYTSAGFAFDVAGNPILSEKKMYDSVYDLVTSHDTKHMLEKYRETHQGKISVRNGSKGDGRLYDLNGEFDYLVGKYLSRTSSLEERRPLAYIDKVTTIDGAETLGNTYIEVNMHDQHLYYYVDGTLYMDMPVVTGNVNRGRGTPAGVYDVYNKRYHTYLRGTDYVSYVNYWLGVYKGVGIHDATWRDADEFGGNTFKRNGSHGCINCPLDSVSQLWEIVSEGTPVILYY